MCVTSSNKGFTLLELLIAVLLMGMLTSVIYSSYFAVMKARDSSSECMEARRELGGTLDLIRREIASSLISRDDKRIRFIVEDRDNFGKPASTLELTTLAASASASVLSRPESGVYNVQYKLVEKDKKYILTRKEQDILQQPDVEAGYPQMERITSFLVECYDKSGSKWVKSWNADLNRRLPEAVRITVQVEENGKPAEFRVLTAPRIMP